MISKCECELCGRKIEFETSQIEISSETEHRVLGQKIECPHCRQSTQIYLNKNSLKSVPPRREEKPYLIFSATVFLYAVLAFAGYDYARAEANLGIEQSIFFAMLMPIILIVLAAFYFLPSIVGRKKKNSRAILVFNIFLGWTFLGWVAALVWASTKD